MKTVRFGVVVVPDPEDESRGRKHVQNIIKYLDSLDNVYESVWMPDHLVPDASAMQEHINKRSYSDDYLECLTTINYLLPLYPNLKFGHLVLCNARALSS